MTGTGTITKIWLSGAFTVALVLSLLAVSQASTDVYYLRPQANTHNNSYNSVSQTFVGTCDTVTKIAFFLGQNSGSSNYLMEIDSAGIAKGGILTLGASLAKAYAENEGTYATPVGVKRGYTYTLRISRQNSSHKVDFYYLADTMAYPWGKITDPIVTGDLCARVVGMGKPLDIWGMMSESFGAIGSNLAIFAQHYDTLGVHRERAQIPLGYKDVNYGDTMLWRDTLLTRADWIVWGKLDTLILKMAEKNVEVVLNPFGSSYKASCIDTCFANGHSWLKTHPTFWAMLYPPKNLYKPVFVDSAGKTIVNPQNLWARFLYEVIRRYGPQGYALNNDRTGYFWDTHSPVTPSRFLELDNEINFRAA